MLDGAIRYAVAVARHGSFTTAAEKVGVTQSAITKRVTELEQRLGFAIFSRTVRGAILTEEGRGFIDRAARMLDDLDDLMRASRRRDPYAGPLRIGAGPASLEWLLIKPMADVMRRHPQIRVDLSSSSFERVAQQLRNGSIDVAVGFEQAFLEQPDFQLTQLGPLRTAYFTRIGHPLASQRNVAKAALAQFDFVTPSVSMPYGADIRDIFESAGVNPSTRLHAIDFFPAVQAIVRQSDAIGVVAKSYASSRAFTEHFALIDLAESIPPSPLCCAVRARWEPFPAVKAFVKACRAALPPADAQGHAEVS